MKILIYAFASWGGQRKNISEEILRRLDLAVEKKVLRVRFSEKPWREMAKGDYDLIVGLGQYPWGSKVRVEKYANNKFGSKRTGYRAIEQGGKEILQVDAELPVVGGARETNDAGRYVCNYSMYQVMRLKNKSTKFGFIHIPKKMGVEMAVKVVTEILTKVGVK
jgi:pyrrolidone-carboxylate peptidase